MSLLAAVDGLLRAGLPGLFGGDPPAVTLAVESADLSVDARPHRAADTEPRRVDRVEELPFDVDSPQGPYTLSSPPAAGPRQVWLVGDSGRATLGEGEVSWDAADSRLFTLDLGDRDLTGVTAVEVRYAAVVVEAALRVARVVRVGLGGAEPAALERAEALVLAVLSVERQRIVDASRAEYADGDYGAAVTVEAVDAVGGTAGEGGRWLELRARLDVAASRALREDEGAPIARIGTPGRTPRPDRPVDVAIDVW